MTLPGWKKYVVIFSIDITGSSRRLRSLISLPNKQVLSQGKVTISVRLEATILVIAITAVFSVSDLEKMSHVVNVLGKRSWNFRRREGFHLKLHSL